MIRGTSVVMTRLRLLLPVLLVILWSVDTHAHDSSAWGVLFRSRDNGARWLPVHEGRFIGGALGLAISPSDVHHLLLATDSGLLRSRNGGRDWTIEAPDVLLGGVFAAAFDGDGVRALASTARGLFRTEDGLTWQQALLPKEALPARAIARGTAGGRVYLAGMSGFWRSDDWGASWTVGGDGLPEGSVSALIVLPGPPETIYVVVGGRLWTSADGARSWEPSDGGMPEGGVDTVASGTGENGGQTWELQQGMLPAHLEAGPLVRDPADSTTLYAGFALTPYDEMWRMAAEGGSMLGRLDTLSLAGGVAFLVVVALAAGASLRWLRRYYPTPAGRAASPEAGAGGPAR
ncbi:MAG: hypothetical protein DMD86_10610 [Candidatus Rokuibacteriota bacterium]|nr:MAG: hypothetical protein DMD86_10610 [Candidatus Rokubacteria bacterium]